MNNTGIGYIEEYVHLVRRYLPESIADDVSSELSSYLTEMARDLGQGLVSEESAKKAIARFGAPAEIAAEYATALVSAEGKKREKSTSVSVNRVIRSRIENRTIAWIGFANIVASVVVISISWPSSSFLIHASGFVLMMLLLSVLGIGLIRITFKKVPTSNVSQDTRWNRGPFQSVLDMSISVMFIYVVVKSYETIIQWNSEVLLPFEIHRAIVIGLVIVVIFLVLRIFSDISELTKRGNRIAAGLLLISGWVYAIAYGVLFGAYLMMYNINITEVIAYIGMILLVFIAYQTATAEIRFRVGKKWD